MTDKIKAMLHNVNDTAFKEHKRLPFSMDNSIEDTSAILRIKQIIDETTDTIFFLHKKDLMSNPITYIIPAVWGKMKCGELNANQRNIYRTIESMVRDVIEIMEFEDLSESQQFSIEYLIRGLVISKITYLIAFSKKAK